MPLCVKVTQLCLTLCDPMDYTVHGIFQARILEWVAFPFSRESSQGLNPVLPHCRRILYQLSHKGSPNESESCSVLSDSLQLHGLDSSGNSPGQNTEVGGIFCSPADLPNRRIEPRSPALQVDSLPTELSRKPLKICVWGIIPEDIRVRHSWRGLPPSQNAVSCLKSLGMGVVEIDGVTVKCSVTDDTPA